MADQGDATAELILGVLTDVGAGARIDHPAALVWLEKSALHDTTAAAYLDWRFASGFGAEKPDAKQAARWGRLVHGDMTVEPALTDWLQVNGGRIEPRFSRALLWMVNHANDDPIAAANLAETYLGTQWTAPDSDRHLHWLRHAAALNDAPSLERLARYSECGVLVPKDPVAALRFRRQAAEAGSTDAQLELGNQYQAGNGVAASATEAAKWYRLAAAQNNVAALVKLSDLLRYGGPGLPRDDAGALHFARRAAALGDADGMCALADLLYAGIGTSKDIEAAAHLYEQAAGKGSTYAAEQLGWIYKRGKVGPVDLSTARRWFEKAAAGGDDQARDQLGIMYREGWGVAKDPVRAFRWFELAARDGDGWAQNEVGWMLSQGLGAPRDDKAALGWFRLAAKNGEPAGDANLGYHYLQGLGVSKDIPVAVAHLLAAARDEPSPWIRDNLVAAFRQASGADGAKLDVLLKKALADPTLLKQQGNLPEYALAVLDLDPVKNAVASRKLLAAIVAAKRPQSQLTVAWHAFLGEDIPYDLALARAAARKAAIVHPRGSARSLAIIDSLAADTSDARNAARAVLHWMADSGDRAAAGTLADRYLTGEGEDRNMAQARHYLAIEFGHDSPMVEKVISSYDLSPPSPDPSPEEIEKKAVAFESAHPAKENRPSIAIYRAIPQYPFLLRRNGVEGRAEVTFTVGTDGIPGNMRCTSNTQPLFAAAAINALRRWRFLPALKDGKAVPATITVPLAFTLSSDAPAGTSSPGS